MLVEKSGALYVPMKARDSNLKLGRSTLCCGRSESSSAVASVPSVGTEGAATSTPSK